MTRQIRFEPDVQEIEKYPVKTGKVLLYGSSFFRVWGRQRAKQQWAEATNGVLQVLNHGFGGATVDELIHYYERLVLPYSPSAIVFRAGYNDICQGKSVVETMQETQRLLEMARNDFPSIKLILILVFDVGSATKAKLEEFRQYNMFLQKYAVENENIETIDLNPLFYKEEKDIGTGQNFRDIFQDDKVHLTDEGYTFLSTWLPGTVQNILETK